jgi:SAM-dependent methyltransferase
MFISYDDWKKLDIFHPEDTYQDWTTKEWYDYYYMKYYYACLTRPGRVLEIGVRLGYSAFSFLSCDYVHGYVGLDIQQPLDGGMNFPTFDWVENRVFNRFKLVEKKLICVNTQTDFPEIGYFDFIHVDGDHSYTGAMKDMDNCWNILQKNGLIVVDDYEFIPEVKQACMEWSTKMNIPLIVGHSKRGDALFWKI